MTNAQPKNWLQRTIIRIAVSVVGATLGSRLVHHLDRLALRWSHGRFTLTHHPPYRPGSIQPDHHRG